MLVNIDWKVVAYCFMIVGPILAGIDIMGPVLVRIDRLIEKVVRFKFVDMIKGPSA